MVIDFTINPFFFFIFFTILKRFTYLFIQYFDCGGSLLLHMSFSNYGKQGPFCCGVWASH